MLPFSFQVPTRVEFGMYTASSAADIVKELGGSRTLIVTDNQLMELGVLEDIYSVFKSGLRDGPVIFKDVPSDSDVPTIRKAVDLARTSNCDSLLAVGGGSVMDTAKVVNICLTYGGEMFEYEGLNNLPSPLYPLVCIPTTAGTGSEVSAVAIVKDQQQGKRILFGSRLLAPTVAILDPILTISLPPKLTAATGFDAISHCIESLAAISTCSPVSDALALEAMALLVNNLERATTCGDDLEARSHMLVGAMMAGLSFTNAGVGLVHALSHAVGGKYGTHHGATNAVLLSFGMRYNLEVISYRYAQAARFCHISDNQSDEVAAKELISFISELAARCNLPSKLRDLGIGEISQEDLSELASTASYDPAIMFNPKEISLDHIVDLLQRAY